MSSPKASLARPERATRGASRGGTLPWFGNRPSRGGRSLGFLLFLVSAVLAGAGGAAADVAVPAGDLAGAQDHPLLARDPGALIVEQTVLDPGQLDLPASALEPTDRRDAAGNQVFAARDARRLEGRVVRTTYLAAAGRPPLDVHRGYADLVAALDGEVLHACTSRACGGDISGGVGREAGRTGIITDLYPAGLPPAAGDGSPAGCALLGKHRQQRYLLARLPRTEVDSIHAAVLTYVVDASAAEAGCGAFAERAVAVVTVVEPRAGGDTPEAVPAPPVADTLAFPAAAGGGAAAASVGNPRRPAAGPPTPDVATGRDGPAGRPPATAETAPGGLQHEEGAVRVFIHHAAADARQAVRAALLADRLMGEGFAVADIRTVPYRIGSARVRYFFGTDLDGARRILRAAGPLMAESSGGAAPRDPDDFTHYEPKPRPGTVEIWLPGG